MTDLRIADAPELSSGEVQDGLKIPTGGFGNYSITMITIRDWLLNYKMFATQSYVDGKVSVVTTTLNNHTARVDNPHQVTKDQVGLGNVDNTSDINKPISSATQTALTNLNTSLTSAISVKANSADVYTKSEVYTKLESDGKYHQKLSIDGILAPTSVFDDVKNIDGINGSPEPIINQPIQNLTNRTEWLKINKVSKFDTIVQLQSSTNQNNGDVAVVKSYISNGLGGGKFEFKLGDTSTPDNVYSFGGVGGTWYRVNWKNPSIYDAGIVADGTDETVKFKSLLNSVSSVLGGDTISLKGKTIKVTDFDMPSNVTIYNGVLDFSTSTTILSDNKYYNGFIIGANRNGDRATNPSFQATYAALPTLENVGFVKVGFKTPPASTYNFSTDIMYFHKVEGFVLKRCYGYDINSNRIVTIAGGMDGTVTSNGIPMFDLVDPINGRCTGIEMKYNKFDAGHVFGVNAGGQKLIVPAMRLTGCGDIDISKNNFKNFNIPILVDAYCKDAEAYNNTCSIDDQVLDVWLSTTSRTDQVGLYAGQSAYNISFYNNKLRNFINKAVMLEGVSYADVYSNISTYSDYAKTLTGSTSLFYGIQLNSNIRQHPYTSVAGVQNVNVYDNRMLDAKAPFIMSSTTSYSMKNIRVNDNTFESVGSNMAMTVNRCFDSVFTNNKCVGGFFIGEVKDSKISLNSCLTPSNYALYLTSAEKINLSLLNNDFIANTGSAIYNGTTSGTLIEIQGGKIQSKDGTSASLQNVSGAGAVRAYGFTNGIVEMRQTITPTVNLASGARTVITQNIVGCKSGWTANVSLASLGSLWTNNSIDITVKAGVRPDNLDILVRNEGSSSVNFTPTLLVELRSFLSNTYTN